MDGSTDDQHLEDLLAALEEAETDPRQHFVVLKWFRDTFLPIQKVSVATAG